MWTTRSSFRSRALRVERAHRDRRVPARAPVTERPAPRPMRRVRTGPRNKRWPACGAGLVLHEGPPAAPYAGGPSVLVRDGPEARTSLLAGDAVEAAARGAAGELGHHGCAGGGVGDHRRAGCPDAVDARSRDGRGRPTGLGLGEYAREHGPGALGDRYTASRSSATHRRGTRIAGVPGFVSSDA